MADDIFGALGTMGAAAIGGVADYFSAKSANRSNQLIARDANQGNRDILREQQAFQERMSGTAYQRATADMRAAGINPMLAFSQGGASTPSGGALPMTTGASMQPTLRGSANTALAAIRLQQELQNMKSVTELNKANVRATNAKAANDEADNAKRRVYSDIYGKDVKPIVDNIRHGVHSSMDFLRRIRSGSPHVASFFKSPVSRGFSSGFSPFGI